MTNRHRRKHPSNDTRRISKTGVRAVRAEPTTENSGKRRASTHIMRIAAEALCAEENNMNIANLARKSRLHLPRRQKLCA